VAALLLLLPLLSRMKDHACEEEMVLVALDGSCVDMVLYVPVCSSLHLPRSGEMHSSNFIITIYICIPLYNLLLSFSIILRSIILYIL
jgi:hypothetical protein